MVTFLVAIKLHIVRNHLLFCDVFENQEIRLVLVVEVVRSRCVCLIIEEPLAARMCSTH